jgi:BA14K-like protein
MKSRSLAFGAFVATALYCLTGSVSQALPSVPAHSELGAPSTPQVEQIQYRRGWAAPRYGHRGFGWGRPGPWIGLGAGIAAGAFIYSQAYLPRRGYYYDTYAYDGPYYYPEGFTGDRRELCSRYFKSFEWKTGMYTTYGGERRLCPYLRD